MLLSLGGYRRFEHWRLGEPAAQRQGGEPPTELSRRYDAVRGLSVHALTAKPNAGQPSRGDLVLVHGLAMSTRYLRPCMRLLAAIAA